MKISTAFTIIALWGAVFVAPVSAQEAASGSVDDIAAAAETIEALVTQLRARAEGYPPFIEQLQQGLITIEQADERVQELIYSLIEATNQLQDGSQVDISISQYLVETQELIAEATGSPNQVIQGTIPALQQTAAELQSSDRARAQMVIEALNLIRSLEQDQEALGFLIRANQVQQAAALISANLSEFGDLLDAGNSLSSSLLGAVER